MPPVIKGFKPFGVPYRSDEHVSVQYEEYEAIRLADYKNLSQEDAAQCMDVSRPTFTRIYDHARKKIAKAFVEGRAIIVEGGNVEFDKEWFRCNDCNNIFNSKESEKVTCTECGSENIEHINQSIYEWRYGRGYGRMRGRTGRGAAGRTRGKPDYCICPECGYRIKHTPGFPCNDLSCPECGGLMARE